MFRKITLLAIPAVAIAVTLFANVDSSFAKGGAGMGGHGGHGPVERNGHRDRGFDRFRFDRFRFDRYGYGSYSWGYPSCYATFPCCACEAPAPVVQPAPVVEAPVVTAQVCPTCEPVYGFGGGYYRDWRFRGDRHRERPLDGGKMGHSGHGKK
jgi:hypothetical protein